MTLEEYLTSQEWDTAKIEEIINNGAVICPCQDSDNFEAIDGECSHGPYQAVIYSCDNCDFLASFFNHSHDDNEEPDND